METKEKKKKTYPILSIRITEGQLEYLRRYSDERKLTIPNYVRAVLFPFGVDADYRR